MRRAAALAIAFVLGACTTVPRSWRAPDGPYGDALRGATREVIIRRGFETALIAYATFDSKPFRDARAKKLAEFFEMPASDAEAKAGAIALGGPGPSFVVSVYTGARHANELEKPTAVWGFHLKTEHGVFVPVRIQRLPHTYSIETLYPYADLFFTTYRVTFAEEASTTKPVLDVAGPAGEAEFEFQ